ncbi:hypothetical protein A2642_04995 [Candidatus Nomurabacteria bacterium RIFCSPHIGHO2_01_FULL_39_10]|uniref:Uncharacterized protein n=1 Tax=Candidatus Nomurabacteria bacterium RIFCSPHIGHO2_01_FULL_39_10 TaxID=1801733 RepID=A0A1F6V923_9BACT|nr:MAG: hypothetical protein A2642_04995 [Candidatus Nomurabacteria bacterium RIFCSPHIGHO2_01_FULL_39_10]
MNYYAVKAVDILTQKESVARGVCGYAIMHTTPQLEVVVDKFFHDTWVENPNFQDAGQGISPLKNLNPTEMGLWYGRCLEEAIGKNVDSPNITLSFKKPCDLITHKDAIYRLKDLDKEDEQIFMGALITYFKDNDGKTIDV